jgi:putative transcriptional regulator
MPACARPVSWLALERHALGELDRAGADELARHLDGCAACRAAMGELSAPGGALLENLPEMPIPPGLWESLKAKIDALPPVSPSRKAFADIPLPKSVLHELPGLRSPEDIRWHRLPLRGARLARLLRDPVTGSVLLLGHMPPRRFFPEHIHLGPEDVLVLAGGYEDSFGTFEAGAYASYAPGSKHRPLTEPDEECWILTRLEKPNLFTGWRGWLQKWFLS